MKFSMLAMVLVWLAAAAASARAETSLWGHLSPGPYRSGFRVVYRFDRTRTWRTTRVFEQAFSADRTGRPIRVNVWYPAAPGNASRRMQYADYVHLSAPKGFSELNTAVEQRDRRIAALSVPDGHVPELLATPVRAYADAPPISGRFPLVLYFGGLNDATTNITVLAEFLASHGYIVATVPILGPNDQETFQNRTPNDIETTMRDMEFGWSMLREQSNVDDTRLAVMGYSLGAIEAFIFANRNANASAVIGLDGTYGFQGAANVLTDSYDYQPRKMRAAVLDLRKAAGIQGTVLDLSAVHALRYTDRSFITLTKMHHSDFSTFAMIAHVFHLGNSPGYVDSSGWTRQTGYEGYQSACEMVRDFLDEMLKRDPNGAQRLRADVMHAQGGVIQREEAWPSPPSPNELVAVIAQRGFEAGIKVVDEYRRDIPRETFVDEKAFNAVGYDFINKGLLSDAIAAFRTVVWAHPTSANALDSLADGYIAAGDRSQARRTYERAIEVANVDPSLDAEGKKSFAADERAKFENLKH